MSFLYHIFSRLCALLGQEGERLQDHWSSGVCFVVAICDQVHDVEVAFQIAVSPASLILQKKDFQTLLVVN